MLNIGIQQIEQQYELPLKAMVFPEICSRGTETILPSWEGTSAYQICPARVKGIMNTVLCLEGA
jgi:hypothetical protein